MHYVSEELITLDETDITFVIGQRWIIFEYNKCFKKSMLKGDAKDVFSNLDNIKIFNLYLGYDI